MRLLIRSAMIFFGTLLAAGLLALGEPQPPAAPEGGTGVLLVLQGGWPEPTAAPPRR